MFNIGGGELLVIGLVALIVLGPQRLPDAARQAGKVLADLRRLSTGFQDELKGAFSDSEVAVGRRDLAEPAGTAPVDGSATSAAIAAVSGERPRRRVPLRAAPEPSVTGEETSANAPAKQAGGTGAKKAARPRPSGR